MIKNLHFVVELGREISKSTHWLHKRKFGPCRARRGKRVPISGVGQRSARLGELTARVPVTIRCPLHESGLKPLIEEAGA